ncbi:hypothetical protein [Kitasatospora sp. NPDC093806]|uniref:hypothetical protein n=1 Tax=Kitasatospora sp. NPDC093806 TaxID=3155075 RepID=UPI003439258B
MDGPALSGRERRLLAEIECDLRRDTRLDRRLSTMGASRSSRVGDALRGLGRRVPTAVLMTALAMSALCLSVAVRRPTATVLVAVTAVWVGSVGLAAGLSALLHRRRRARVDADGAPDGGRGGHRERRRHRERHEPRELREQRQQRERHEPRDHREHREHRQPRDDREDRGPGERRERRPWDHPEA